MFDQYRPICLHRIKKGDLSDEDKKKLGATAGAVIAFVAAVIFGGYKYHQVCTKAVHPFSDMLMPHACQELPHCFP
jgi:hypothetical protein